MTILLYCYIFWLLFIVTMAAKASWDSLPLISKILVSPAAILAVLMDVFFNICIASFLLCEFPHELMFTKRLDRYLSDDGWRERLARWICKNLLDPFQLGGHCKKG